MSCGSVSRHGEVAGRRGLSVRLLRLPSFCYSTCLFLKGFISGTRTGSRARKGGVVRSPFRYQRMDRDGSDDCVRSGCPLLRTAFRFVRFGFLYRLVFRPDRDRNPILVSLEKISPLLTRSMRKISRGLVLRPVSFLHGPNIRRMRFSLCIIIFYCNIKIIDLIYVYACRIFVSTKEKNY